MAKSDSLLRTTLLAFALAACVAGVASLAAAAVSPPKTPKMKRVRRVSSRDVPKSVSRASISSNPVKEPSQPVSSDLVNESSQPVMVSSASVKEDSRDPVHEVVKESKKDPVPVKETAKPTPVPSNVASTLETKPTTPSIPPKTTAPAAKPARVETPPPKPTAYLPDHYDVQNMQKYASIAATRDHVFSYEVPATTAAPRAASPKRASIVTSHPISVVPSTSPTTTATIRISEPLRRPSVTSPVQQKFALPDQYDVQNYNAAYFLYSAIPFEFATTAPAVAPPAPAKPAPAISPRPVPVPVTLAPTSTTPMYQAAPIYTESVTLPSVSGQMYEVKPFYASSKPIVDAVTPSCAAEKAGVAKTPAVATPIVAATPVPVADSTRIEKPVASRGRSKSPVQKAAEAAVESVTKSKSPVRAAVAAAAVPVVPQRGSSPAVARVKSVSPVRAGAGAKSPARAKSPAVQSPKVRAAEMVAGPMQPQAIGNKKKAAVGSAVAAAGSPVVDKAILASAEVEVVVSIVEAVEVVPVQNGSAVVEKKEEEQKVSGSLNGSGSGSSPVVTTATTKLNVTAKEFVPSFSTSPTSTHLRPTAAEFTMPAMMPPYGADPTDAYNPYATASVSPDAAGMYPSPATGDVGGMVWDQVTGQWFPAGYDVYEGGVVYQAPVAPRGGKGRMGSAAGKGKGGVKGKKSSAGLVGEKAGVPSGPTLADFIKVDKKKGVVAVVGKDKKGANGTAAAAGSGKKEAVVKCVDGVRCERKEGCGFYHPTEVCRFYPECRFGEECLYIHEEKEAGVGGEGGAVPVVVE
ncbi:hypothetical protein HDU98_008875 [Podochytrium sp. JEL0797]|nr:hypothetical protein HDU98_008875 [Podochytrium sp. JEL0797]